MIPCVSVENMRFCDAYTIANWVSGLELMHRAAYGIYKAIPWTGKVAIVTGSGNNGGDGYALACILWEKGIDCKIFKVSDRLSEDSAYYARKAKQKNIDIVNFTKGCLDNSHFVVDCLLGTGFQGPIREEYRTAIEEINASDAFVVSADINSGLNGDTGAAEIAVRSDVTVTIGFVKKGLVSENAGKYIKRLVCADIGIILRREEEWISDHSAPNIIEWPEWLDRNVIKVY